jgi:Uma2 family endonuclease
MASTISQPLSSDGQILRDVEWEEYCRLRDDPSNDHLRMTYLDGTLTIISPQARHDRSSRSLLYVVTAVVRAWRIVFLAVGTTTLRRKGRARLKGAGKEPDDGFYFGEDVAKVEGVDDLDLTIHPPPNLAIEVDNTVDSESALPTYARIRVPEVWIYKVRQHTLRFGRLVGDEYQEIDRSLGLPRLTPTLVLQALDARSGGMNNLDWLDWLDAWARALPEPPEVGR